MASDDLVGGDGDAPPLVLGLQHPVLDELLPDLIFDLVALLSVSEVGRSRWRLSMLCCTKPWKVRASTLWPLIFPIELLLVSPDQSTLVRTKISIRIAKMAPATFALLRNVCIMGGCSRLRTGMRTRA